jgi:serine phosphatase RsbU (regulator of sigma subunit)
LKRFGGIAICKYACIKVLLSITMLFGSTYVAFAKSQAIPVLFEYTFQDGSVKQPDQIPSDAQWKSLDPEKKGLKKNGDQVLWMRATVSEAHRYRDPVIQFYRLQEKFSFFVDGKKITSFGEGTSYAGLPVHLIEIPKPGEAFTGFFRVESSLPLIGPRGGVYLGSRADFIEELITGDMTDLFIVCVLCLIGLAGLALFTAYPSVKTYLFLGGFAVTSGLYFVGRMPSKIIFGLDPVWTGYLGLWGLFATPLFFVGFFREIFSIEDSKFFRGISLVAGLFLCMTTILSFFTPSGPLDFLIPFYPVASFIYVSTIIYAATKLRKHPYVRTFYFGFCILFMSGIWEIAREFRIFSANIPMLTWGFLCFALSLVVMQGQYFSALFKLSKKNERLADDARLRLERVLDCTRNLARTRNYKELIRVVADALLAELKISNQDVSVDFFMPSTRHVEDSSTIHQFTYIVSQKNNSTFLYEVSPDTERQKTGETGSAIELEKLSSLPGIENAAAHSHFPNDTSPASVLTIPLHAGSFMGAVIIRKYSDGTFENYDFALLSKFVNSMSASLLIALQNLGYVEEVKEKVAMESELDAAVSLQAALLPDPPEIPDVIYSAYCKSAGKTGGDWHGYHHCEQTNRLFLTIGDVTGHDFAASIMTGLAAGAVKAWQENDSIRFDDAARALENLAQLINKVFCSSNRGLKFMSMTFACIELTDGKLHLVNAGHPHPIHFSANDQPKTLPVSGNLLGQNVLSQFASETLQLNIGDTVFFYTDGLFENQNKNGQTLSRRSLFRSLSDKRLANEMIDGILECAQKVWGDAPPEDDVTFLAITWKPRAATAGNAA